MTNLDAAPPYENWIWREAAVAPGNCVVVDVDGVIADGDHRQRFLTGADVLPGGKKDWKNFFAACVDDAPLENQIAMINSICADHSVILLTARPNNLLEPTLHWLATTAAHLRWDALILRAKKDGNLRSPQFKQRSIRQLKKQGYNPLVAFDDDVRNVDIIRAEDVPTVYIHSGYYEV